MRVLIATQHLGIVGGVETYLRAVLSLLRRAGVELAVLAEWGEAVGGILDDSPDTPVWHTSDTPGGRLPDELLAWRPEVVYSHGLSDCRIAEELASLFPTVYFAHDYKWTCISGTKCHAFPAPQPCSRPLGPGCLALYYPQRCGGLNPLRAVRSYRTRRRWLPVLRRCTALLVASRHMADEMIRNGIPSGRVHLAPLFPTGIIPDPEPPQPRPPTGRVLFVGRITASKGWSHLLAAMVPAAATLGRRLTLVVAGDGTDRPAFEAEARRCGVPAEFHGWVDPVRREAQMRAADVLIVPSVWPEPFGLVGIEAGCVGLPAVGYAVGGIPDWLTPGVSGESAPGQRPHPKELAEALVRALADDSHWQRLRIGAWETAQRFSPTAHLDRLLPVLKAAAGR